MAEALEGTEFIPKTIKVTQDNPKFEEVEKKIGFPCIDKRNRFMHNIAEKNTDVEAVRKRRVTATEGVKLSGFAIAKKTDSGVALEKLRIYGVPKVQARRRSF